MALAEVDKAPFGWYHIRLAVVTGIGFFTDAYSVSLVVKITGEAESWLTTCSAICHKPCRHFIRDRILAR
jgi:hypothetical protein